MLGNFRRLAYDDSGAVYVEAALILPLLLVFGFVALDFSYWLYQHQVITAGVRDAARYLARVSDPTNASMQSFAANIACYGDINSSSGSLRVPGCSASVTPSAISNAGGSYRGPATLYSVTATANFTYQGLGVLAPFGFNVLSIPIGVSHTERWVGG